MVRKITNNNFKRLIFFFSIALNIATISFFIGKRIYYSNVNYFHPQETSEHRLRNYLMSKKSEESVVFIGTSITLGFPLQKEFSNSRFINLGFAGITNEPLFNVIKQVVKKKPKKIFLEMGINNIRYKLDMETTINTSLNAIEYIKRQSPTTRLYVQSVLPTKFDSLNTPITIYNQRINQYCQQANIKYIDLYPSFVRNGVLDDDLTIDGIHLNETGYFVVRKCIESYAN
jgi:lysophospholipase L1-like esterase